MEHQQLIPTPATEWKGATPTEGTPLELPSGNVALVKPVGPQAFLASGLIPDPLTAMVRQAVHSKQGLPPAKIEKMIEDPKQIRSTMEMFDRVTCWVVLEPKVVMPPTCIECGEYNTDMQHGEDTHEYVEAERRPGVLYVDTVDIQDKTFIFQWSLGGTRDLETFRQEQQAVVDAVPNRKDVQRKAKRPAGRKR